MSAQFRFDAFGGMYAGILALYNHTGLTGKEYDAKSGLIDFGARWYDPFSGRFAQADTYKGQAGIPATQHAYAYTGNNPINFTDPTGHYTDPGGTYHEISDDEYEDLANQQGVDTNDPNSPWKDIVDQNLDNQYNQGGSGGSSGGDSGGGSSDDGGGGYTPPPPIPAQLQANFNASSAAAKTTVYAARPSDQETKTFKEDTSSYNGVQKPSTLAYEQDRYYNPGPKTSSIESEIQGTTGVGFNYQVTFGFRIAGSAQYVQDQQGNKGLQLSVVPFTGGGSPSIGVSGILTTTNARSIDDLAGKSTETGGSLIIGYEKVKGSNYTGTTVSVTPTAPPEVHHEVSYSLVIKYEVPSWEPYEGLELSQIWY